jgi:hypothetical protein
MRESNSQKTIALVVGVLAMVFFISLIVRAWTEPGSAPPGGNVPAPINVGLTAQTKTGNLTLLNLYLNAVGNEGNIYNTNLIQGYNDLMLYGSSAKNVPIYLEGNPVVFNNDTGTGNVGIGIITPGYKLDVSGGDINVSGVYRKGGTAGVSATCAAGNTPSGITISGGIVTSAGTCTTFGGGGITSINSMTGPAITIAAGTGISISNSANTVTITNTGAGGGDITGVTAGNGLTGGGLSGDVTLNIGAGTGISVAADSIYLTYSTFSCSAGYSLASINLGTGGQTCEYDDVGAGGGIGGSGNANYVAKFTAGTTIGNSQIYDNGSNVGIGTTGPGYKLDVAGDIRAQGWLRTLGATGWYSDSYGGGWYMSDSSWIRAYSDKSVYTGGEMQAGTVRGNSYLCIASDCRNVWPGGAGGGDITGVTAGSGLTGGGLSGDVTLNIGAGTGIGVGADSIYLNYSTFSCSAGYSLASINLGTGGQTCEYDDGGAGGGIGGSGTAGYLARFTAGTTIGNSIIYDNGVAVGIGTTSPGAKLVVVGNVGGSLFYDYDNSYYYVDPASTSVFNCIMLGGVTNCSWPGGGGGIGGSGTAGYIARFTAGTTIGNSVIWQDSGGNIGINYTSPAYRLDLGSQIMRAARVVAEYGGGGSIQVGDDVDLYDVNYANLFQVRGRNNAAEGRIQFGSGGPIVTGNGAQLTIGGNLGVQGSLSKYSGSFDIPHPDPEKAKDGWHLRHSFVESPTRGEDLYRWQVTVEGGKAEIILPDYFKYLNENVQIWVSPVEHFGSAYGEINQDFSKISIEADADGVYNVLAIGTRKDEFAKKGFDELGVEYQQIQK